MLAGVLLHEFHIIPVGNKADVLAVRLFPVVKALGFGDAAGLLLGHFSQREEGVPQLLLSHGIEDVALILGRIQRLFQEKTAVLFLDPGVVAGDYIITAVLFGEV